MNEQNITDYERVAKAIEYIQANFKNRPSLGEVAAFVHLSPFHFQRLFTEWAGTSPKKFLQYISLAYAKNLLKTPGTTIANASFYTGLSGTSRLHDLFIKIEGMTPAEFRNGGAGLHIHFSFSDSLFGKLLVASTQRGVCHLAFIDNETAAVNSLKALFPKAIFQQKIDDLQQAALLIFKQNWDNPPQIKLHLKGTDFQLKVWELLIKIPLGALSTYGNIAEKIGNPLASRAVGSAIGSNPVAFVIPCHRVIQASGILGGYRWGPTRKTAMIGWENAKIREDKSSQEPLNLFEWI